MARPQGGILRCAHERGASQRGMLACCADVWLCIPILCLILCCHVPDYYCLRGGAQSTQADNDNFVPSWDPGDAGDSYLALWGGPYAEGCLCNAGYATTGVGCTHCLAGTYKQRWTEGQCTGCSCGTYATNGSTTCTQCPVGKASAAPGLDFADCRTCGAGFVSGVGDCGCVACVAGKYQTLALASSCISCPSGKAGTVINASSMASGCAINCIPGYYSTPASTACQACAVRSYSGETLLTTVSSSNHVSLE